jgi:very-short-patch-repair endonuclease
LTASGVHNVGMPPIGASPYDVEHVDALIARLATDQDGVVARAQLAALGLSRGATEHRLRTGRLIPLYRGVYAVGHTALTDRARARAALLVAGPTAVLSHQTAAAFWKLIPSMPPLAEVTVTTRARRNRANLRIHQTTRPPGTSTLHSLPLTAPLRTLVDLARSRDIERLCSEALALNLTTEHELAQQKLLMPLVAPTRSELERRFLKLVHDAGFPRPVVNHPVGRYVADFAWLDHRVIVETDGYRTHGHRAASESDHDRAAHLTAEGWVVLRFTWRRLRDEPLLVAVQLAQVLSRRSPRPRGPAAA